MPKISKKTFNLWPLSRKRSEYNRPENAAFYNSARWRKISRYHRGDNPLCAECERNGRYTGGDVCDHIIPIIFGGHPTHGHNLQTLCHSCHNKKSAKEKKQPLYASILVDGYLLPVPIKGTNDYLKREN